MYVFVIEYVESDGSSFPKDLDGRICGVYGSYEKAVEAINNAGYYMIKDGHSHSPVGTTNGYCGNFLVIKKFEINKTCEEYPFQTFS